METLSYAESNLSPRPQSPDSLLLATGMAFTALCVGCAVDINLGDYEPTALTWLSVGLLICIGGICLARWPRLDRVVGGKLATLMAVGIIIQTSLMLWGFPNPRPSRLHWLHTLEMGVIAVAIFGVLQATKLRSMRPAT